MISTCKLYAEGIETGVRASAGIWRCQIAIVAIARNLGISTKIISMSDSAEEILNFESLEISSLTSNNLHHECVVANNYLLDKKRLK